MRIWRWLRGRGPARPGSDAPHPSASASAADPGQVVFEPRACPHCLHSFPEPPKRDTFCSACGEQVWVMRDRETGGRFLLTKEQAELLRADNEEARRSEGGLPELSARCQRWLDELEVRHGVLRRDFERERERATEDATEDDILWRLLELLARQKRDYTELTELYEARARFLDEIGRDFGEELRRARAVELLAIKEQGDTEYVKLRGADCKTCMEMDGRRIALERAMREMPLPASDCERTSGQSGKPLCTCTYAPVQNPELRADPSDNSEQENGL